jgi:hypothetical protein
MRLMIPTKRRKRLETAFLHLRARMTTKIMRMSRRRVPSERVPRD